MPIVSGVKQLEWPMQQLLQQSLLWDAFLQLMVSLRLWWLITVLSSFRKSLTVLINNNVEHVQTAPKHPSSNGLAERAVQTVKRGMKKTVEVHLKWECNSSWWAIESLHRAQQGNALVSYCTDKEFAANLIKCDQIWVKQWGRNRIPCRKQKSNSQRI